MNNKLAFYHLKNKPVLCASPNFSLLLLFLTGLLPGCQSPCLKDDPNVFVTACGTGFYSQCLPDNTVHIGISNSSFHFLSTMLVLFSVQVPCTANTLTIALVRCWKSCHRLASFIPLFVCCVRVCVCSSYACWCLQVELIAADNYSTLCYFTHPFLLSHCSPCRLKNAVVYNNGGSDEELSIWREGARIDWERLLLHRAREMVKGTARLPFICHAIFSRR